MTRRRSRALLLATATAALCVPATAGAEAQAASKTMTLKATVLGGGVIAERNQVVPVLLSRHSTKRSKLDTPLAYVYLRRSEEMDVKGSREDVHPRDLRAGDQLRLRSRITSSARRSDRPRIRPSSASVNDRMRDKELEEQVEGLREHLGVLTAFTVYTVRRLDASLGTLTGDLSTSREQIDEILSGLRGLAGTPGAPGAPGEITTITKSLTETRGLLDSLSATVTGLTAVIDSPLALAEKLPVIGLLSGQVADMRGQLEGQLSGVEAPVLGLLGGLLGQAQLPVLALPSCP